MLLGRFFDIDVKLHWSWWVFLAFYCADSVFALDLYKTLTSVIFIVSIFGLVLGHEFAHALTARKFGYQTKQILLHLLGGVALINMSRAEPKEEIAIDLAGPLFNLVLSAVTLPFLFLNPGNFFYNGELTDIGTLLTQFIAINLVMGVFNLLPAYPMDGGRIFRSLCRIFFKNERKAVRLSHIITVIIGVGFAILGLVTLNAMMALLGGIILFLVYQENQKSSVF